MSYVIVSEGHGCPLVQQQLACLTWKITTWVRAPALGQKWQRTHVGKWVRPHSPRGPRLFSFWVGVEEGGYVHIGPNMFTWNSPYSQTSCTFCVFPWHPKPKTKESLSFCQLWWSPLFREIDHNPTTIFPYSLQFDGLEDLYFSSGEEGSSHTHEWEGNCVSHGSFCCSRSTV
jgi:hypothetical protein